MKKSTLLVSLGTTAFLVGLAGCASSEKKPDATAAAAKSGEGSCGGDKKGEGSCGGDKKAGEGSCGEGSCGGASPKR